MPQDRHVVNWKTLSRRSGSNDQDHLTPRHSLDRCSWSRRSCGWSAQCARRTDMRILAGASLIAHGLVHVAIWVPRTKDAPFDVGHSPLFGDVRAPALSLAMVPAVLLIIGGIGLVVQASW